jgi:hypothetical protein
MEKDNTIFAALKAQSAFAGNIVADIVFPYHLKKEKEKEE